MISFIKEHRITIQKYGFWIFVILGGLLAVILEDVGVEPLYSFSVFFYFVLITYWSIRWLINQRRELSHLKTEQSRTELLHLQSQVNPHFFFNMLNNLYGLVEQNPQKARELILKLSDLMRYSIYEGQNDLVTIEEEVEYLKNYVELHKMRYHKEIDVQLSCTIEESGFKIMPLLFIILLENAFKHGVENLRKDAFVHINMEVKEKGIEFTVENNFDTSIQSEQPGIGLKNLRRRLHLVYPKKHKLLFGIENDLYKAQLTLLK